MVSGIVQGQIWVAYLCLVHAKVYAGNASCHIFFGVFPTRAVVKEIDMRSRLNVVGLVRGIVHVIKEKPSKVGSLGQELEMTCKDRLSMGSG